MSADQLHETVGCTLGQPPFAGELGVPMAPPSIVLLVVDAASLVPVVSPDVASRLHP